MSNALFVAIGFGFFFVHYFKFEGTPKLIELTLFSSMLLVVMLCDLRTWRVPKGLALVALGTSFLFGAFFVQPNLWERAIGAALGFICLWCVLISSTFILRSLSYLKLDEFSLGAGDPLLLAVIGSFLGYAALPSVVFLGCLQGVASFYLLKRFPEHELHAPDKGTQKPAMPLGAFLCFAALELLVWPW